MSLLSISAAPYDKNEVSNGGSSLTSIGKPIERKKMFNKTYRNHNQQPIRSEKVNSVLQSIHNRPSDSDGEDDDVSAFGNFETANYAGTVPSSFRNPYENMNMYAQQQSRGGNNTQEEIVPVSSARHNPKNPFMDNTQVPSSFYQEGMRNVGSQSGSSNNGNAQQPSPMSNDALQLQELRANFSPKYNWNRTNARNENDSDPNAHSSVYPATFGASAGGGVGIGDAYYDSQKTTTDKLNYIITLLEEQQDQRTNHVTEEIVLYSFLGVFMIFIVDSFVRVGKYVR